MRTTGGENDLARLEEARSWKELSLSTDFRVEAYTPGATKVNLPPGIGPRTCRLFAAAQIVEHASHFLFRWLMSKTA